MNKYTQIISILVTLLLVSAFYAFPAAAAPDPLRGVWVSTDIDGSSQRLVIGGGRGDTYHFRYFDDGATVCGLDPDTGAILYAASAHGLLTRSGDTLSGDLLLHCYSRLPSATGPYAFTFTYNAGTDTLTDQLGVVWSHR